MISPPKARIQQAFDQAAITYHAAADVQREMADQLWALLRPHTPHHILDAGCGTGDGARRLSGHFPNATVFMVDFAPHMLRAALTVCPKAQGVCADIEALPLPAASLDLYWSNLTWQWNDPKRCAKEAARVLSPQGMLAISTLCADNFSEIRHAFRAVDEADHVLCLPRAETWRTHFETTDWTVIQWMHRPVRRYFPDVQTLLHRIKSVGAHTLSQRRPLHKSAWQQIVARYETLRTKEGLPLTYDALWCVATRNGA